MSDFIASAIAAYHATIDTAVNAGDAIDEALLDSAVPTLRAALLTVLSPSEVDEILDRLYNEA